MNLIKKFRALDPTMQTVYTTLATITVINVVAIVINELGNRRYNEELAANPEL